MKKILFTFILSSLFFLGNAQSIQEGIKHMENENYMEALKIFNGICKGDPKNSIAYFYIGEVHYQLEDYNEAEKAYRKGLSINTQCAECYVGIGKLALDNGNTSEAEKNFKAAINVNKKQASTFAHIGDAYLYNKKPNADKAIEYLYNAKTMKPSVARYWAHLGDAYNLAGNSSDAMTSYEYAVEKDPTNAEAYISMARIWRRAKQEALAIPKLQEAIRLSPNDARPIKDLYELYIQEKKYDMVVPLLERYISLIGTDIDAKVRLVKFLTFQAKDYDRSIPEGEKLLKTNPEQYTLHRWLAWSYAGKAKQMEEEQESNAMITDTLIKEHYQKAYNHSVKLFDELTKDSKRKAFPEDYDVWALSALKTGDIEKGAHVYRKYIEFEPERAPDIYGMLAKTYYEARNYPQAIAYYNRKIESKPLTNTEEFYLGLSHYYNNQYVEADSSFARVLRATPNYASGYLWRAKIASAMDSTQTLYLPKPHYEKYIEVAEADSVANRKGLIDAYYYLGVYYAHNNDLKKAEEFFDKVLILDSNYSAAKDAKESLKAIKNQNK